MACGGVQIGDIVEVCFDLERSHEWHEARVYDISSANGPFYVEGIGGKARDICTEHGEGWHWRKTNSSKISNSSSTPPRPEPGRVATLDGWMREQWLGLRDDASPESMAYVRGAVDAAAFVGLLTESEAELWLRRIQTCPGHDDEGGRSWCGFCGRLAKVEDGGNG